MDTETTKQQAADNFAKQGEEPKNIPFTKSGLQDWKEQNAGRRAQIMNTEPNRKARRLKATTGLILNNRQKTKGRGGNPHRVLAKMSRFHLKVAALTGRL